MGKEILIRGFNWFDKDWISTKYPEMMDHQIVFGMYNKEGYGTDGDMAMEWIDRDEEKLIPELQAFSDSWEVLYSFHDLLKELAKVDDEDISQEQFVEILLKCGFKDITNYKSPHKRKSQEDYQNV